MTAKRLLFWSVAFTVTNSLVKGANAAVVVILAMVLPPASFANFGMLYAMQSAMGTFAASGLGEITAGRLALYSPGVRRRVLFKRVAGFFIVTASLALILIGIPAFLIASSKGIATPAIFAILLGAVVAFGTLQAGFQRVEERHGPSLLSSAGVPLASIVGLMLGVWWAKSLEAVFGFALVGAGFTLFFLLISGQSYTGPIPRTRHVRRDVLAILPFAIMGIFGWLSGYGMNLVIDGRFDSIDVARYTFLFTVSSIAQMVASSMNMVWAPRFYHLFNEGKRVEAERQNRNFFAILALVLGATSALVVALLPWLTYVVGGNLVFYGNFRFELALLFLGYIVCIPWWHGQNYYFVSNRGHSLMRLAVWSGIAGLFAWIACMLFFGSIGIFLGFPIQIAMKSFAVWLGARKQWGAKPPWLIIILAGILIFSGMAFPQPGK
ncbi:MAG: oligosaccharide flippase family protein [Cytophaga sp.]|nr:oligosaccharide flippase family protein [Undibacterium sp.]